MDFKGPGFGDDLPGAVAGKWPTPTVCGNHNRKGISPNAGDGLATVVNRPWPMQGAPSLRTVIQWVDVPDDATLEAVAGRLNPAWVEALMGFPAGWTELQPGLFDGPPDPDSYSTRGSPAEPDAAPTKPSD